MLEIILLASIVFLIITFFYKQTVNEFRINQIEWSQVTHLPKLYSEKLPIVVRSISPTTFWTFNDACQRPSYDKIAVFNETTIAKWLRSADNPICPWRYTHAEKIAKTSGIAVWAAKWFNPSVCGYKRLWTFPKYYCWAGDMGLHKIMSWTCLISTESEIHVTIMPESMEQFLPAEWMNTFPAMYTEKDTPFLKELKYLDIILRPGTALFMPPHWFMSWISAATGVSAVISPIGTKESVGESSEASPKKQIAMACTISYHTPISYLAFQLSPLVQR